MATDHTRRGFINAGHFFDHFMMLLFPTAVIGMEAEFGASYGVLLSLSTAGFIAFGAGALPAGWLADRWDRESMLVIFFVGLGSAAIITGLAQTLWQIAAGLLLIGIFASIYHPVGIAMLVEGRDKVGRVLGINGIFGNMGVAGAALIAGWLTDFWSWRAAFILPGVLAIAVGLLYLVICRAPRGPKQAKPRSTQSEPVPLRRAIKVLLIVAVITTFGGFIFSTATISLPKLLAERAGDLLAGASGAGTMSAIIFAVAAFSQIAVGNLIDRYPIKLVLFLVAVGQAAILLVVAQFGGIATLIAALALMSLVFGEIPIGDTLVARYTQSAWRSRVYAIKYVLSLGVSATAVPMISILHESQGFGVIFAVLAIFAIAIAVAALALPGARSDRVPARSTG